jgi:argininosuccinate lyase
VSKTPDNSADNSPDNSKVAANPQWGGRFAAGPSAVMQAINNSIGFDHKLWRQDIRGSLAHAAMLARIGIISAEDEQSIGDGLGAIAHEIETGRFPFDAALEDIHMNIEARLTDRIGEAGRRLHTARSRNDQVAVDFRLWVRDASDGLAAQITDVMRALADRAAGNLRPPSAGLRRDAGPRPRPACRLPSPAERMPAGQRRAGGHVVSHRPRNDRAGAGF